MTMPIPHTSAEFPPCSEVSMTPAARRRLLLPEVDVLVDIGANEGQYASWIRSLGFSGRIISFEPQATAFAALSAAASRDHNWECLKLAIGPEDSELELRLARDSTMTSAFPPTDQLVQSYPQESVAIGTERVQMRSLESLWPSLGCVGRRVYLKADVEGFELAILEGADSMLSEITVMELELSLTTAFAGAPLITDVLDFLIPRGFSVVAFEQNHSDVLGTAQMYMVDGIFRNSAASRAAHHHSPRED
jgi:FkbM family methyltransferase